MKGFNSLFSWNYNSSGYNPINYMSSFNPSNTLPFDNISQDDKKEVKTLKQYYRSDEFVELERMWSFKRMILIRGQEYIMDKFYDYFINSNVCGNYENYNMITQQAAIELLLGEWTNDINLNFRRFDYFMTKVLNFRKQQSFYMDNIEGNSVSFRNPFEDNGFIPLTRFNVSRINKISKEDRITRINNWLNGDVNNNRIDKKYGCFY